MMALRFRAQVTRGQNGLLVEALVEGVEVDRPRVRRWLLGHGQRELAGRLARAIEAGVATPPIGVRRNLQGQTYLATRTSVAGAQMSATLHRLGF